MHEWRSVCVWALINFLWFLIQFQWRPNTIFLIKNDGHMLAKVRRKALVGSLSAWEKKTKSVSNCCEEILQCLWLTGWRMNALASLFRFTATAAMTLSARRFFLFFRPKIAIILWGNIQSPLKGRHSVQNSTYDWFTTHVDGQRKRTSAAFSLGQLVMRLLWDFYYPSLNWQHFE